MMDLISIGQPDKQQSLWMRLPVLLTMVMLFLSGCLGPLQDKVKTATPTVPPLRSVYTLPPGVKGAIESMTLITSTENSEYYTLTYWSDGLRVTGFFGRPKDEGLHPAIIYNRGGYREFGALEGWEIVPFVEAGYVAVASQY